jgi:tetratricopeptide (TPR) repeat protein
VARQKLEDRPSPRAAAAPDTPADTQGREDAAAADDQALLLRQTRIVESYLSFRRKDSLEFLELEEGCTVEEIDRAYLEAAEIYAPWSLQAMGVTDFAEQGALLFLRAARAYAEVRDTESRGALLHRRKVLRDQEADRKKAKFSIETDLLDPEEQFQKGMALADRGDLAGALKLLEFASDCDPQSADYRAELAYRRDQFEPSRFRRQSIADLREAVRIDPHCGPAHYYLGLILASEEDFAGAEEALRKSIKLLAPDRRPIDALRELSARKRR